MNKPKKAFIITFGCQMNIDDSDQMRSNLESSGFVFSDNYLESDIIIINTCTVREKPEKKLSYFLDSIKNLKKKNKNLIVVVTGCVAQQKGKEILDKYPVDIVLGVDNYYKLLEHYNHVLINREKIIDLDFSDTFGYKDLEPNSVNIKNSSAYLTVVKGCNNFCSYCIVPYVRGREKSRLSSEILENVKHLINSGISSITLLGQNIARFGIDNGENLSDLLYKISDIKGLKRLSFLTTHPKDFSADIADCFRNIKNLTPMLHLPIQHGSNKILKAMNRKYTKEEYLAKIDALSDIYDRLSITTDVILGFPGEEEDDFAELMSVLEKVRYDNSFSFIYSPRSGTSAFEKFKNIPFNKKVYTDRLMIYQKRQKEISFEKNKKLLNTISEVLVEGFSSKDNTKLTGRTNQLKVVNFNIKDNVKIGDYVNIKITKVYPTHLYGEIL